MTFFSYKPTKEAIKEAKKAFEEAEKKRLKSLNVKPKSVQLKLSKIRNNINFNLKNKENKKFNIDNLKKDKFFINELILFIFKNKVKNLKQNIYIYFKILLHFKTINLTLIELDCFFFLKSNNNIFLNFINYKNKIFVNVKNTQQIKAKVYFNTITTNFTIYASSLFISKLFYKLNKTNLLIKHNFNLQKNLYMFFFNFTKQDITSKIKNYNFSLLNLYTYKFLFSFLYTRKINNITPQFLKFFLLKFNKKDINNLKFLLWKNNNLNISNKLKQNKLPLSYLYFIYRIEDKLDLLLQTNEININKIKKLKDLRNLFYMFLDTKNKFLQNKSSIIMNPKKVMDFKNLKWKSDLISFLTIKNNEIKKKKNFNFLNINNNILNTKVKKNNIKILKWKKPLNYNIKLISKKIVFNNSYFNYKNNQELISLIFGFKLNIYFINALSITRFDFHIKMEGKKKILRKKRSASIFIKKLEQEFLKRYKFVANYLQDFARIGFIALYTKDLTFLLKFIAFQIKYLQKNRKETKLIKFIIKAIKIFSAQRREVLGLKIQFKGRVNRWRRTKIITGARGIIPFNSYKTAIEYATATAITRKGALGIRLWVYLNKTPKSTVFTQNEIEPALSRYIKLNKILKYKQITTNFLK